MIKTLSDALADKGYDTLTAVQEAVNAPELQDADLLVSAQTGSGKTVGFGLAIARTLMGEAEHLGPAAAPLALVVAPTRELAFQVMRELGWLFARAGARVASCVGGMDMRDERRMLERGVHIVVGTPGRLCDHIRRGSLDMTGLRAVVLDEADEMLDLGFRDDLEFILAAAPADRRTLMFSATVPPTIATLAKQYQRDAVRITTTTGASQHADIAYQALRVAEADAENAIFNLLRFHDAQNAMVFANTRAAVNHLTARLANRGFAVVTLSGELSQSERTHALQAMRDGRARVCVATDVAARGLDLPNLELVIHADLPSNAEGLLHRSGRTGRAGRKGISALIIAPKVVKKAERLLKFARIQADWTSPPGAEDILRRDEERLLAGPAWDEETTEDQSAFAARLLALHSPERIAAAYLRLYRARQSAPEDLTAPDTAAPKQSKPFGAGTWFALSVGRDDRAEARWLLPLLCRAGNLDKDAIGAIRVQSSETYVEIAAAGASGFLARLGESARLEDGITVRQLDGAPDFAPTGPAPRRTGDRPPKSDAPPRETRAPTAAPVHSPPKLPGKSAVAAVTRDNPRQDDPLPLPAADRSPARESPTNADVSRSRRPNPDAAAAQPAAPRRPRPRHTAPVNAAVKPGGKPGNPSEAKPASSRSNVLDPSKRVSIPGKPGRGKTKTVGPGAGGSKAGGSKAGGPKTRNPKAAGTKPDRRKARRDGGQEPPRRGR